MQAEWFEADYWIIDTIDGTCFLPQHVESDANALAEYVEGSILDVTHSHGWIGRMSAPGYLDCTDWIACATEAEVKEAIADLYDLDPETMQDDNV